MTTIKAVTYDSFGDSSVLKHVEVPAPQRKDFEVEIKVVAAGVNPVDWKVRSGVIASFAEVFPVTPGWDAAGVVVAAPEDSGLAPGDEVFTYTRAAADLAAQHPESAGEKFGERDGCAAERICVPAWKVAKKPTSVSLVEAASVPLAGLTAYQGLHDHGKLQAGQTVLILGGSGGVGGYAISIAKAAGATVLTSCSSRNVDYVKERGADIVLDYTKGPIKDQIPEGTTVDLVYDAVGGDVALEGLDILREGGTLISIARWTVAEEAEKVGKVGKAFLVCPSADNLRTLAELIDTGKVAIPKIQIMDIKDIKEAHDASATSRTTGKIVLKL